MFSHSATLHKGVKMATGELLEKCEKRAGVGGGLFDGLAAFCGRGGGGKRETKLLVTSSYGNRKDFCVSILKIRLT